MALLCRRRGTDCWALLLLSRGCGGGTAISLLYARLWLSSPWPRGRGGRPIRLRVGLGTRRLYRSIRLRRTLLWRRGLEGPVWLRVWLRTRRFG
jgi:hypothetical protein